MTSNGILYLFLMKSSFIELNLSFSLKNVYQSPTTNMLLKSLKNYHNSFIYLTTYSLFLIFNRILSFDYKYNSIFKHKLY